MTQNAAVPDWSEALLVGVESIDEDHRAFFVLSHLLRNILSCHDEDEDVQVETILNILEEYVEGHFFREQKALAATDYPDLAEHILAHDYFADRVRRSSANYKAGDRVEAIKIADLINNWMFRHIEEMDSRYRGILTNENVDNRPLAVFVGHPEV